jgi:DNA modification methylase
VSKLAAYTDAGEQWVQLEGEALLTLAKLPDACIDGVITDPPYGITFHDERWDGAAIHRTRSADGAALTPNEAFERWTSLWARQAARVLKPGGHLLAFGAPRTFHRLVAGIEDAGLEVRDQLLWLFGTGLPKSRRLPEGRATALKPAYEPILLARRPLQGSVDDNHARFGTGTLNLDAARVDRPGAAQGYWPTNVLLSHAPDCPVRHIEHDRELRSRLFYCAKAPASEREAGCEQLPVGLTRIYNGRHHPPREVRNTHPTVKPLDLMRWLVRLAVPDDGVVLDPFAGSGTTGAAAVLEGHRFLGIEREGDYVDIACTRLHHWAAVAAQDKVLP